MDAKCLMAMLAVAVSMVSLTGNIRGDIALNETFDNYTLAELNQSSQWVLTSCCAIPNYYVNLTTDLASNNFASELVNNRSAVFAGDGVTLDGFYTQANLTFISIPKTGNISMDILMRRNSSGGNSDLFGIALWANDTIVAGIKFRPAGASFLYVNMNDPNTVSSFSYLPDIWYRFEFLLLTDDTYTIQIYNATSSQLVGIISASSNSVTGINKISLINDDNGDGPDFFIWDNILIESNISAPPPVFIRIDQPLNTTYLNNNSLPLNAFAFNTSQIHSWFYNINSNQNTTIATNTHILNTTIVPVNGINKLTVYYNLTNSTLYSAVLYFFANYSQPVIRIDSPRNITYYNNLSLRLNVYSDTIVNTWFFNLGNGQNTTVTGGSNSLNTTLSASYGVNLLSVYANYSGNLNISSASIYFTVQLLCGSATLNNYTCSGEGGDYVVQCKQVTKETYQWDYSNMTRCQYGCYNGQCFTPAKTCYDRCNANETTCTVNSVVRCELQSNGCYDWSDNKTRCSIGCLDGRCISGINQCNLGDSRCQGNYIIQCGDDNGDGYREWSANKLFCQFGCTENLTAAGMLNVSCNIHSFDDVYSGRDMLTYFGRGFNYVFPDTAARIALVLVLVSVIGILVAAKFGGTIGMITAFLLMFVGFAIWVPEAFYILVILVIIGGIIIFYVRGKDDSD